MQAAFAKAPTQEITFSSGQDGSGIPWGYSTLSSKKKSIFQKIVQSYGKEELAKGLNSFSFDQHKYYTVVSVDAVSEKSLISFEKGEETGLIGALLQKKLSDYHEQSSHQSKNYDEVKKEVFNEFIAPLKKNIQAAYKDAPKKQFYQYYFYQELQQPSDLFSELFNRDVKEQHYVRYDTETSLFEELYALKEGQKSSIYFTIGHFNFIYLYLLIRLLFVMIYANMVKSYHKMLLSI